MAINRYHWIITFVVLFAAGIAGGYIYFSKKFPAPPPATEKLPSEDFGSIDDLLTIRVYYPVGERLLMEERMVQRRTSQIAIAEAVIREFLKEPSSSAQTSVIPKDTKLLDLYKGADGILYADLSDEFRRNFEGDAAQEFLLLKGLYESLISNVQEITDVKILIEGKEMESLGGHIYLIYPLGETVAD